MPFLRQSTSQTILFGPCLDKTDGVTEEVALTLAQADMRLSKDGGAFAQKSAAGNATHDSDGWYSTTLSTTDTNTVGELILNVHQPANMLPVWMRFWVLEEAIYDNIFGASATGLLPANVTQFNGGAIPAPAVTGVPDVNVTHHVDVAASVTGGELDVHASTISSAAAQTIRDEILPTQNAAFNNLMFLFVAASDHVTPVTGATGTAVTRSIDGGAFGSGTGTLAEVGNGIYQYDASAADMNGGVITFRFTATGGTPGAPDDRFVTVITGGGV